MIKAIIFDLGGVLFTNGTKRFIESVSSRYSFDKKIIHDLIDGDLGTQYREAKISREDFWTTLIAELEMSESIDELEKEWIDGYELFPETQKIIQELSSRYNIYYLSDNVKERIDLINKRFDFLKLFNGGVFSHEVGHRKPHPEVYKAALKVAGVEADEALYIDDKPSLLPQAKELGMLTIQFESPEKLREDLQKNSIL